MRIEILSNGVVVNTIMADAVFAEARYPGAWRAAADQGSVPASVRRVTVLGFRNRFTTAEKVTIDISSLDVPTATSAARQQAAGLRANMTDTAVAAFIDLDRTDTRSGVQQLEAAGLLAVGRAAQILDGPINALEVFR